MGRHFKPQSCDAPMVDFPYLGNGRSTLIKDSQSLPQVFRLAAYTDDDSNELFSKEKGVLFSFGFSLS